MSKQIFSNILLMARPGVPGVEETLVSLIEHLQNLQLTVAIEKSSSNIIKSHKISVHPENKLPPETDLVIVVGGDGSLLSAAHLALKNDLPVLGINRGRLGFLTDIHPDELNKIEHVLKGNYVEERRFLLQAELSEENRKPAHLSALNDVVLLPGNTAHMIEFETHINNQFVCRQRADGLIIATPTGSTAYALSGGGPILHPKLDAIVIVPMFPHTLSSRPIVISGDSDIKIIIGDQNETEPCVSSDGQDPISLPNGGLIHINKKPRLLRLIHPEDYNYYSTLREKLGWEKHAVR